MTTALVTFLGRVPKQEGTYRSTEYEFADGSKECSAFFGFTLQRQIRPDHLVILGTSGSMWDHLFERDVTLGNAMESERLALIEAVEAKTVTQVQLDTLAPTLAHALGCTLDLRLIPYARNEHEQLKIVHELAAAVPTQCTLHLDITHGFRHLPLIATMAVQYLRVIHPEVHLQAIWYGAYDFDTKEAQVHNLAGLLEIADGAHAIARFDYSGDYSELAELLPQGAQQLLREAAFLERTHQVGQARSKLKMARVALDADHDVTLSSLFKEALLKRINWVSENRLYQRQRALALEALRHGDELRTALYGYEALITRQMQEYPELGNNPDNYEQRQVAKQHLEDHLKRSVKTPYADYKLLRDIRNQLAHGIASPRVEVQRAMADTTTLRTTLDRLLHALLPDAQ